VPTLVLGDIYPNHAEVPPSLEVEWEEVEGLSALYRIVFQSMALEGLPEQLKLGSVHLLQTRGPLWTRRVDIVQRPQAKIVWDKTNYPELQVAAGVPLTVCHLPVVLPTEQKPAQFAAWRDEIYSATGLLVALLDDRVAQRELFEDFLLFDGDQWIGLADRQGHVRNFLPFPLTDADEAVLHDLPSAAIPEKARVAARWYLRGAQLGPAADGIPLFWTALEAIVGAEGRQVVRQVEDALREIGEDPATLDPSVGRLFGLRADIVHHGEAELEPVVVGWYALERICRNLFRHVLEITVTWPDAPGDDSGLSDEVRLELQNAPETVWHEPDDWL